ncbi:3511_t:CDS:2 [Dentiscutata erythropus]|uniref:3511_t:CDS:1 n=1 Tax=Dentiscutata erythropus TaxID=1348616 RepID=A0A9N9NBP4_9GLOM|nr:3511_t:CDS:2 [Dentiscutata erythropus]
MLERDLIQTFDYSEFSNIIEIARGSNDIVYSAEYREAKIAFKQFNDINIKEIVNEIKQHMTVNNSSGQNNYMIVLEYANEIILIAEQIIFGLKALHHKNIVHGDLHPKNILIVRDDKNKYKVAIADFGSATRRDDSLCWFDTPICKGLREKMVPGTPSSYSKLYNSCWSTNPKKRPELQ